ncbi:MAG: DUF6517 family protein [Haloplanus sp.]
MTARRSVALVAVAMLTLTAGCGFLTGGQALTFDASPATVSDAAASNAGYQETNVSEQVVTRNFTVANQTRQVEVTNQLAQYERQVDLGPLGSRRAAVFVAFASPQVDVAGQTFNPISDMSEREVLEQFESEYDGIEVGQQVDNRSVTVLGQSVAVEKFEGTASLAGTQVDVYVHAAKLEDDGDYVVAVAIYPQRLDGEEQNVVTLLEGLQHSGE